MRLTPNMTNPFDADISQRIAVTPEGMAHWAGSGPGGATCRECVKGFDHKRRSPGSKTSPGRLYAMRCLKFKGMTGKRGSAFDPATSACRFFEQDADPKPLIVTKMGAAI